MELNKAMKEIADLNEKGGKGTVKLQGRTYTNVSTRVEIFRKHLALNYGIDTEVLFPMKGVMMIAKVKDKDGFVVGSGHAYAESLQKDKSLEKLESVAVGRAMASIGLSGGEYASDSEIESWQERYEEKGIHMTYSEDDVDPADFINSRVERIYKYIDTPKANLKGLVDGDQKTRQDPIFQKIIKENLDELRDTYEIAIKDAETKLKKRLKEKETKNA